MSHDEAEQGGAFRPFGETNVPSGLTGSVFVPPPTGSALSPEAEVAVGDTGVRKRRRVAGQQDQAPPDLDRWIQVLDTTDPGELHLMQDRLVEQGFQTWHRIERFNSGRAVVVSHQLLVPDGDDELAAEAIERARREAVAAIDPQPGDAYFALRSQIDREMPKASWWAKDRAARKAWAELDGASASSRLASEAPARNGCRRAFVVGALVFIGVVLLAVAWSSIRG